jgi:hypothetical protein
MATIELTTEDLRILQTIEQSGGITISENRSAVDYRRLAAAGFLEHQAVSMDTEWFGITDKGREALAKTTWV